MQSKIILVSVLAATASVANAQSSVTLYGALDAGLLYQNTSAASLSTAARNSGSVIRYKDAGLYSSNFGMKGTEDLGGGLYANFRLQGNFNSGNGQGGSTSTSGVSGGFNQVATVGISGPFGAVDLGRQYAPLIKAMNSTDVRQGAYFGSVLTALIGVNTAAGWTGANTNGPLGAVYDDNAIVYTSPAFRGITANLEYSPGGSPNGFQAGTRKSATLLYNNYGFNLSAIYYDAHDANPSSTTPVSGVHNNRFVSVGALYAIKGFSFDASYSNAKDPSKSKTVNYDLISGGFGYRFSPALQLTTGVYYQKDNNNAANKSTEVVAGLNYYLSKALIVYAQFGRVDNKGAMNQTISYGLAVAPGITTTACMVGLRHTF